MQVKHKEEIILLRDLIEKTLSPNPSPSPLTPLADPGIFPKSSLLPESSLKNERWNQAKLGYFNSHLDGAHGKGEVVSLGKEVYYKNVVLFVQQIQSLITF